LRLAGNRHGDHRARLFIEHVVTEYDHQPPLAPMYRVEVGPDYVPLSTRAIPPYLPQAPHRPASARTFDPASPPLLLGDCAQRSQVRILKQLAQLNS
jgi:hypothetical protein